MENIFYKLANPDEELLQILALQKANSLLSVASEEKLTEGFVTVEHTFELLKNMNEACQHCIAKDGKTVVGYALSMVKSFGNDIEVLKPMFDEINTLFPAKNYLVMGQICIDKNYRKLGIFKGLYRFMQQQYNSRFEVLITEIDKLNTRSMAAHRAIGFETIKEYSSGGQDWALVAWEW